MEGNSVTGMVAYSKFLSAIVHQTIFIFLLIGAAVGLIAGVMLLLDSAKAFRISNQLNRWVSSRAAMRPLEEHYSVSRPLYRMHRLVGMLICAGALYSMVVLGSPYGEAAITKSLSGLGPTQFASWISESLRIFLLVGNLGAFLFGLVFIVRPSALRGLEAWADRRISARKATKPLEELHVQPDQFTREHPRLVGSVVLLGSLYVLANLGFVLFSGK